MAIYDRQYPPAHDYNNNFIRYCQPIIFILNKDTITKDDLDYLNTYNQVLNQLLNLSTTIEKESKNEEYLYYYAGKCIYDYTNQSFLAFETLMSYSRYVDQLYNDYITLQEKTYYSQKYNNKIRIYTQVEIDEAKNQLLHNLEEEGYTLVDTEKNHVMSEKTDSNASSQYNDINYFFSLKYNGVVYDYSLLFDLNENALELHIRSENLEDVQKNHTFDELKKYSNELIAKWIPKTTYLNYQSHNANANIPYYYLQYIPVNNKYQDFSNQIYFTFLENGQLKNFYANNIEQFLSSYDLTQTDDYTINQDLSRLDEHLPEHIADMCTNTLIIKDSNGLLLYELEIHYYGMIFYYYIDYETFEYEYVKERR